MLNHPASKRPIDQKVAPDRPAEAANARPRKEGMIYDEHGIPNAGSTAFVIFLLPFLAAIVTFVACFLMFRPSG